eukprot:3523160-Amphidinium_carterae.1
MDLSTINRRLAKTVDVWGVQELTAPHQSCLHNFERRVNIYATSSTAAKHNQTILDQTTFLKRCHDVNASASAPPGRHAGDDATTREA